MCSAASRRAGEPSPLRVSILTNPGSVASMPSLVRPLRWAIHTDEWAVSITCRM